MTDLKMMYFWQEARDRKLYSHSAPSITHRKKIYRKSKLTRLYIRTSYGNNKKSGLIPINGDGFVRGNHIAGTIFYPGAEISTGQIGVACLPFELAIKFEMAIILHTIICT